ncbi:MAG: OmpA family protein [Ilumatobacter sp.]|nr:OmpA family protein [Ilumatobacter sp.]
MVSPSLSASRYRRRILGLGVLATGALYVIGAPLFVNGIEEDLERRVPSELAAAGFDGVVASFSGQDGALSCARPLDDPEGAIAAAYDIRGVRAIDLDRSCRVQRGTSGDGPDDLAASPASTPSTESVPATTASPATTAPSSSDDGELLTVLDIVAADPDLAFLSVLLAGVELPVDEPFTLFAPANGAFDAIPADQLAVLQVETDLLTRVLARHAVPGRLLTTDLVDGEILAADGAALSVTAGDPITVGGSAIVAADIEASNGVVHVIDGLLLPDDLDLSGSTAISPVATSWDGTDAVLSGVVASEVERQIIVSAAVDAFGLDFVRDELAVDPDVGVDEATSERLATLVRAMPDGLASGEVGFDGDELYATGVYRTEEGRDAFVGIAGTVGVEPMLSALPTATVDQAATLEADLNAFIAANPITFQPASTVLDDSAAAVLDEVAGRLLSLEGLRVVVEGHTDSDGEPVDNLILSQARAAVVRAALIARGVDGGSIEATGVGSEQPVVVDGVEDKAASRRVEFRVTIEGSG